MIDGKSIEAKVKPLEEARNKYEDSIAQGKGSFIAQLKSKNILSLNLGGMVEGAKSSITIRLFDQAELIDGAYHFKFPASFVPNYKRHQSEISYTFRSEIRVNAPAG